MTTSFRQHAGPVRAFVHAANAFVACALAACLGSAQAQDIEPRAYSNAPIGVNFLVAGYARSHGGLSLDPSIPLTNARLDTSVVVPLLLFAPQLAQAKRDGLREYGTLAERYVRAFDAKWLRGTAPPVESLVGSGDIQSLADMNNSFEVVRTMRAALVTRDAVLQLGIATLVPLAPLLLTMMPLEELLKKLFGILF